MSKHTPGPWHVRDCGNKECWCRIIVAEVPDCEGDEQEGVIISSGSLRAHNARLIAAAPDLLAALRDILESVAITETCGEVCQTSDFSAARAAIAAAQDDAPPQGEK